MPPLIDNYSAQSIPVSSSQTVHEIFIDRRQSSTSVIIVDSDEYNLINGKILGLLNQYSTLQHNWDEDGARAPWPATIQSAKSITLLLSKHGQAIFHTAPGPNGEIMLDLRSKSKTKSLEIILYPNKTVAVLFPEQGSPSQQKFNTSNLPELLNWLNQK